MFVSAFAGLPATESIEKLRQEFADPPADARIMMRWWWFGAAVKTAELERELKTMQSAGIGGVEIQPVYPLALDDPQTGIENLPYMSAPFLDAVRFASKTARNLGMRVDITLGSGWPYGGPDTTVNEAAGKLRFERVAVPEGAASVPIPAIAEGEKVIAAFVAGKQTPVSAEDRVNIPAGLSGSDVLLFFISSRTGQQVKRVAVGAEGFVLDHYTRSAIEHHLTAVANPLLEAFGANPPHAVFSDSLEVYASDWTPDLLHEFQKRRGYDLTPHLPALINDMGRETQAVRHDWGKTLTELAEENYLQPIHRWAASHGTLFRSQTYGEPPVILSSNALVDLPEGEHGPSWRRFSAARWASSAAHLYGKPLTSTETWTWLHSPAFRATPLDMKAEADRHFIEGINQLIGHGWPYSPPSEPEPGWCFYAAASFNHHNPWFEVMPDIAKYLQRISFLLRQGRSANDIAIYVPTDDAWSRLVPGKTAVDETVDALLGPALVPQVLNAGYGFDFIDDRAIEALGVPYKLLILPGVERIPLSTMHRLQQYAKGGGMIVATRSLPSLGTGLLEEKTETAAINSIAHELFATSNKAGRLVENEQDLSSVLPAMLPPDLESGATAPAVGFVHRTLPDAEIYFLANSSNRPIAFHASFRLSGLQPQSWDPFTGKTAALPFDSEAARTGVPVNLAPYESRVIIFAKRAKGTDACCQTTKELAKSLGGALDTVPVLREFLSTKTEAATTAHAIVNPAKIDLGSGWKLSFPNGGPTIDLARLRSWTEEERTRYYSGIATYEKSIDIPPSFLQAPGSQTILDFGPGTPVEPSPGEATGMRALLESPVHEAAIVFCNGQRAGSVWHPPYEADLTPYLHPGNNLLRIEVGNLAINEMAGRALPDYRLLNLRYGERFVPQGFRDLRPLPSGITGPLQLIKR